ncbi:MAG TPA: hypothetical protein VF797_15820 [Noviherbaspirillum sp.]
MKILKRIGQGEMLPPFYGVAWVDFMSRMTICLPVPLNVIAALLRTLWLFLKHGWRAIPVDPRAAYDAGMKAAAGKCMCPTCQRFYSAPLGQPHTEK